MSSGKGIASAFHHVLVRKPTHVEEAAKIPEAMAVIGMKISFKPMRISLQKDVDLDRQLC